MKNYGKGNGNNQNSHLTMGGWFHKFACRTANIMGSPLSFLLAVLVIVIWAILGPAFHYSDSWQLVINTGTTIVTFLMVFLIQNTQNRDAKAFHLKLDELIHAIQGARTRLVNLEQCSDEELEHLQREFERLRLRLQSREESETSHRNPT